MNHLTRGEKESVFGSLETNLKKIVESMRYGFDYCLLAGSFRILSKNAKIMGPEGFEPTTTRL